MKLPFTLLLLQMLLLTLCAEAQSNKPVRKEIPVKDDKEVYKVVPCEENGTALIFLSDEGSKEGQMVWITSFLNTKFTETQRFKFELPKGFILEDALYGNNHLLAFFYTQRASADTNFYLIDFNLADSNITTLFYPVPGRAGLSHFAMAGDYAIAGINTRDDQSMILRYDIKKHQLALVSSGMSEKTVVESLSVNQLTGGFSVILRTMQSVRKRSYYLIKYSPQAQPYFTHMFSKFGDYLINNAYIHEINASSDIIIGSYGTSGRTRNMEGQEVPGVASVGFFSLVIDQQGSETVNTYNFTDFEKFYRYLRRSTEIAPRRSILRRDKPVRDTYVDYNLLSHDIFKHNGEFIFMSEAFYPEYRVITTMVYDYYGRPYPSTYTVFEGFKYLTTFIAGFNERGELMWNNDLELTDATTDYLNPRVTAYPYDSTSLMVCYVDGDRLAYKLIEKGQNLSSVSYSRVEPYQKHDKVQKESNSYVVPWYDDFFLVYGYQTVRNSYTADRARNIFYLSKLAFRL